MNPKLLRGMLESMIIDHVVDKEKQIEVRLGQLSDPRALTFLIVAAEVDQHGRLILIAKEAA